MKKNIDKNDNYSNIIGLKIKQLRKSLNKTQDAFCDEIDLEVPNLSKIENGKSYPSLNTVLNIISTYKLEPNEFFNFLNWELSKKDDIILEIDEYLKPLSLEIKIHIRELLKNLTN